MHIQVLNNKVKINIKYGTHKDCDGSYNDSKQEINLYVGTKKKNKEALSKYKKILLEEKWFKGVLLHELTHALFIGHYSFDSMVRNQVFKDEEYAKEDDERKYQECLAFSMEYAPYLLSLRDELWNKVNRQIRKDCK